MLFPRPDNVGFAMPRSELISTEQQRAYQLRHKLPELVASVRLLVVGDVMLDRYWFGDVSRISPEAPVPFVQIRDCDDRLGGAANVARNVAALGAHATLVGRAGQDEAARCLQALLARECIQSHLQVDPNMATTIKLRVLSRRQQMLRIDFDASSNNLIPPDIGHLLPLLDSHDAIVLSDYDKGCLPDPQAWISAAQNFGLPVLVDPKVADFSRYAGATILKPNFSKFVRATSSVAGDIDL